MKFNSIQYAVFLAAVVAVYWQVPRRARPPLLLLASYAFYATLGRWFPLLLIASTGVTYVAAAQIDRAEGTVRRTWLVLGLVGTAGVLVGFKVSAPFLHSQASSFDVASLGESFAVPAGLSFYTFQAVSHLVDVYRKTSKPCSLLDTALYLAFFPHLLAGPILRSRRLVPAFHQERDRPKPAQVREGVELLLTGLFRKVALADPFLAYFPTRMVDQERIGVFNLFLLLCGMIVAVYFDVSAYIDLARGSAKLLGIDMQPNFAQPLTRSRNWTDFWRRWQITTMAWFRDYVYALLLGRERGAGRQAAALMGTFLVVGLWHDVTVNFVIWGVLTGGLLTIEQTLRTRSSARRREARRRARRQGRALPAAEAVPAWRQRLGPVYVFAALLATFPWVATADLRTTLTTYGLLLRPRIGGLEGDTVVFVVVLVLAMFVLDRRERRREAHERPVRLTLVRSIGFAVMAIAVLGFSGATSSEFVYLRF